MAGVVGNVRATNPNAMIIHSAGCTDSFKLVDVSEAIMKCTGMDYNNVVFEGHSAGCFGVTRAAGRYARLHPNNSAPTLIMADGYYSVSPSSVKSEDIEALNKMGATIIELSQSGKTPHSHGLEKFIGNGSLVLYLDPTKQSKSKAGGHGSTYNHAFGTDLIGYALGNGGNFDGYNIKFRVDVYDPETGKLVKENLKPADALKYLMDNPTFKSKAYVESLEYVSKANFDSLKERVNNLQALQNINVSKLANLDNISSDKKYALDGMQKIIGIVSSTKMLGGLGGCGTSSTTRVPVCAKDYVYSYSRMLVSLLEKVSNEAVDAIGVALEIDTTDMKLKSQVDNFEDLIIAEETGGTTDKTKDKDSNKDGNKNKNGTKNKNGGGGLPGGGGGRHRNGNGSLPGNTTDNNENSDFLPYDSIIPTDNRLVYEIGQGFKVIFDKDENNNITNMEYYYDFGSEQDAISMVDGIKEKYSQLNGFETIVQSGQYIKVIFSKEFCNSLTSEDVMSQYGNVEKV